MFDRKKGFTLIELLVVISIIALLSSIVLSTLNDARAKARDTQRIQAMQQLRNALELYRNDNNGNYAAGHDGTSPDTSLNSLSVLVPTYIPALPQDPTGSSISNTYLYRYCNRANGSASAGCDAEAGGNKLDTYAIRFQTEKNSSLGAAGLYCLTPGGIHKESTESSANNACEQR